MKTMTNNSQRIRTGTLIYLLLLGLTVLTWAFGRAGVDSLWASLAVFCLALFKGHLIGDFFMGLKRVDGFWRWTVVIWLVMLGVLIGTAYILAGRGG